GFASRVSWLVPIKVNDRLQEYYTATGRCQVNGPICKENRTNRTHSRISPFAQSTSASHCLYCPCASGAANLGRYWAFHGVVFLVGDCVAPMMPPKQGPKFGATHTTSG